MREKFPRNRKTARPAEKPCGCTSFGWVLPYCFTPDAARGRSSLVI